MSKEYALKLAEKILSVWVFSFIATYVVSALGSAYGAASDVSHLSIVQRCILAATGAVVQLLLGTTVAPFVGDPNSPSVLPNALLTKLGASPATAQIIVTVEDVAAAVEGKLRKSLIPDLAKIGVPNPAATSATSQIPLVPPATPGT